MGIFLNEDEIKKFTTCHSKVGQIHWLRAHDVRHFVNDVGGLSVPRGCLDVIRDDGWRQKIFATKADALANVSMPRRGTGIYFLLDGKEILYIGKTTNFFVRLAAHDKGNIPFTKVSFFPMPKDVLNLFEVEYISKFRPPHNVHHMERRPQEVS